MCHAEPEMEGLVSPVQPVCSLSKPGKAPAKPRLLVYENASDTHRDDGHDDDRGADEHGHTQPDQAKGADE